MEGVFLVIENEAKQLIPNKVKCDVICDTRDLIERIDSACDTCNLVDAKNKDSHVVLTCSKAQNNPGDISNNEFLIQANESLTKDDEIGSFEKHTKGIGSKLLNKMDFDGKGLGKSGQGIKNLIQICVRPRHEG